ncbi:MAG: ribosome maturation factor RimM [Bryobacteraceae bacterium]
MNLPEDAWVTVARLGKTRGNRGEITALPLSDRPDRYQALGQVYLCGAAAPLPRKVERTWFHNGTLIFKFQGVDSISDAELLTGMEVRIPIAERTELEPGEFFQSDLVGCEVVDRKSGGRLGRVEAWQDGGGCGLLVVEGGLLIPFARSICVEIDVQARRIAVDLPEGLRELNAS